MTCHDTSAHLAWWAGVCPGRHESAGKSRLHARPGNVHLQGALGIAAMAAARTNGSLFQHRYKRLAARRGLTRGLIAIEHSLLIAVWHILSRGEPYRTGQAAA